MDERCAQFAQDAARRRDGKTPKEIARLQKFLFNNQDFRFTSGAQQHLFNAVGSHVAAYGSLPPGDETAPALALVEDALKMPFTVFTTSHKRTMMKWLDKLTPGGGGSSSNGGSAGDVQPMQVLPYRHCVYVVLVVINNPYTVCGWLTACVSRRLPMIGVCRSTRSTCTIRTICFLSFFAGGAALQRFELIDLTADAATLMSRDGDTLDVALDGVASNIVSALQASFDAGDQCFVNVKLADGGGDASIAGLA